MALFRLKNEEFERAREGDVIEHGRRPGAGALADDDGDDDADDQEDGGCDDDG